MDRCFGLLERPVEWGVGDLVMYWAYREKAHALCSICVGPTTTVIKDGPTVYQIEIQ